jgi:hypothetical protein
VGGDLYRLLIGVGDRWEFSKPIQLPDRKPAQMGIDIQRAALQIRVNGTVMESMALVAPIADSPGPINLGAWIGGACRFSGTVDFFEIAEDAAPRSASIGQ